VGRDWILAARPSERFKSTQLGPWFIGTERLKLAGQIPATVIAGGEGEPAREDQGTRGNLAGGDVQVEVDRRRWNGDDPRRRWWSSTMVGVFRCVGDWRGVGVWSRSCARVM
jgi:hypothetical protein